MAYHNEIPEKTRVLAAVVQRAGRLLLARRPSGKRHAGLWEFPGGKFLLGETPLDAARRELAEELGGAAGAGGAMRGAGNCPEVNSYSVRLPWMRRGESSPRSSGSRWTRLVICCSPGPTRARPSSSNSIAWRSLASPPRWRTRGSRGGSTEA